MGSPTSTICAQLSVKTERVYTWDGCYDDHDPAKRAHPWGPSPREAVEVTHDRIKISEEILFDFSSATIAPSSEALLASIAQVMLDAPEIEFVEIAGHADDQGSDENNQRLTARRALSVMGELVKRGVDRSLLRAAGYSSYCPLDTGTDLAAKAKNRRVEFRILRRDGEDLDPKWGGCAEAEKRGMKPPARCLEEAAARSFAADAAAKKSWRSGSEIGACPQPRVLPRATQGVQRSLRSRRRRRMRRAGVGLRRWTPQGRQEPSRRSQEGVRGDRAGLRSRPARGVPTPVRRAPRRFRARDPKRAEDVLAKTCAARPSPACACSAGLNVGLRRRSEGL